MPHEPFRKNKNFIASIDSERPGHTAPIRLYFLLYATQQEGKHRHRRRRQDLAHRQGIIHGRGQTHRNLSNCRGILVYIVSISPIYDLNGGSYQTLTTYNIVMTPCLIQTAII